MADTCYLALHPWIKVKWADNRFNTVHHVIKTIGKEIIMIIIIMYLRFPVMEYRIYNDVQPLLLRWLWIESFFH